MKFLTKSLFIIFLFPLLVLAQNDENRGYKVKVGQQSPNYSFKLLDETLITKELLLGKVVVLQFTASWCGVCRKEMPHLEKEVWQRFKNKDFILIGIDLKEDKETVKEFIQQMNISYPIGIDKDGSQFELFTLPNAGVTRNIVIDKKGEIIFLTRLFDDEEFGEMITVIDQTLD